jgi:hypothetical protein
VIQREGPGIRWSMMDLLGIPQARQKLVDGTWHADGLLPPNPKPGSCSPRCCLP